MKIKDLCRIKDEELEGEIGSTEVNKFHEKLFQGTYLKREEEEILPGTKKSNFQKKRVARFRLRRPFTCCQCGKNFAINSNLTKHMKIHTGEKSHQCSFCEKRFSHLDSLKYHERIHSGEKPFKCSHCEKRFRGTGNLKIHERIHTGEKMYGCPDCGKSFVTSKILKTHRMIHSGEKPHVCSDCGKSFRTPQHLKRHRKRIHTREKPYQLGLCN